MRTTRGEQLTIQSSSGSYSYGLNRDALTFGWRGLSARIMVIGKDELKMGERIRKRFSIVDYDASESSLKGDKKTPRRVHLKLFVWFSEQR
jgi:hypothetical protein